MVHRAERPTPLLEGGGVGFTVRRGSRTLPPARVVKDPPPHHLQDDKVCGVLSYVMLCSSGCAISYSVYSSGSYRLTRVEYMETDCWENITRHKSLPSPLLQLFFIFLTSPDSGFNFEIGNPLDGK